MNETQMRAEAVKTPRRRPAWPIMALLLVFTLGILVGMTIALVISMQTFQMDFIYPSMTGWGWA